MESVGLQNNKLYKEILNENKNIFLTNQCKDVVLEAKRVLLNEQLEKIANITLSTVETSKKNINDAEEICNKEWSQNYFWNNIPNPRSFMSDTNISKKSEIIEDYKIYSEEIVLADLLKIEENKKQPIDVNKEICKKYFNIWQNAIKFRKEKRNFLENKIEQKEKLDKFIKTLKKCKKTNAETTTKCTNTNTNLHRPSSIYKNRFNAQKSIIETQKAKLDEQNKIIQELKVGIVREDLMKSLNNTKYVISEIFSICSEEAILKGPLVKFIDDREKMMVLSQKAPKVVQEMEKRALERAQNRAIILERKRLIEEHRKKLLEDAIEKKRVLEEEEKKTNLQLINERRKKDLELEKKRQTNKQKYLDNLFTATQFYDNLLKRRYFKRWLNRYKDTINNCNIADAHYVQKLYRNGFSNWYYLIEYKYKLKFELAESLFMYRTLQSCFATWHNICLETTREMQTAEDLYDFRITSNIFIHWKKYMLEQKIIQEEKSRIAQNHFERRIVFQYFYQWRSLPAVLQLEKAKELKKRKWREKVWEILPDFNPESVE